MCACLRPFALKMRESWLETADSEESNVESRVDVQCDFHAQPGKTVMYYDSSTEEDGIGWWISPSLKSETVFAYGEPFSLADSMTPETASWRIPHTAGEPCSCLLFTEIVPAPDSAAMTPPGHTKGALTYVTGQRVM